MAKDNSGWLSELAGKSVAAPKRETLEDLVESRPFWDSLADFDDLPAGVEVHEAVELWDRGERTLGAEIYVPEGEGPFPLLVHIHGGGYCVSRAINDRKYGMRIAARGYTVLSPDYALAPEYPFPWAVEECLYAARWLTKNAAEYRGDPSRLVLEGGSAGAGLSAAAIIAANGLADGLDQGGLEGVELSVVAAVLFYGMFSFPQLLLDPGSNVGSAELWNRAYLGAHFTTKLRHPLVSMVYAPNLDRFPPAYISCGHDDSFLGHTLEFTKALADANATATVSIVEGQNHNYAKSYGNEAAQAEVERAFAWLAAKVPGSRVP
ncbi:MAG TPA: alpha/beta hydrolase fold domain-containing protein [Gaiellaceae bacterium]|jgi:acetyl esterase/lipase|nr:alpha/beta hydrolase fold domain-containing protein [Gaiellaceae bacterium]